MANQFIQELELETPNITSFGSCAGAMAQATLDEALKVLKKHRGSVQLALTYALTELLDRKEITDEDHADLTAIFTDFYSVSRGSRRLDEAQKSIEVSCGVMQQRKTSSAVSRVIADIGREQIERIKNERDGDGHDEEWVLRKASLGHQILATAALGAIIGSSWGGAGAVIGAFAAPIVGAVLGACSGDDDDDA